VEKDRHQIWYLARHLKQLSGDLAAWGFSEAALLVGAAAISIGDKSVRPGMPTSATTQRVESGSPQPNSVRHG
jgi:hypothetical protein